MGSRRHFVEERRIIIARAGLVSSTPATREDDLQRLALAARLGSEITLHCRTAPKIHEHARQTARVEVSLQATVSIECFFH
jgi:hypothetical protein